MDVRHTHITNNVDVIQINHFNKTTNMLASEGPTETAVLPTLEWAEDGEFDEDDEFDELRQKSSTTHQTLKTDSIVMETNKTPTSHRPDESKTVISKTSQKPLNGYPTANFKRDPAVDVIVDSRKVSLIENAYTRLAQTTSQRIRSSQQARLNSFKLHPMPAETNQDASFPERNGKRLPLVSLPQFVNEAYDDGLGTEFDQESMASMDKSSVQVYEETCKRLNICPCSTIIRSLYTTHINLANYGLGPRGCAALAVALVRNTTVISLDLTGNNIGNSGMSHIYQILTENAFVEEYNLSVNKLGTKGIRKLAAAASLCLHLRALNVAGNDLCATDLNVLLSKFEDHPNLKELNISHNLLDEEGGMTLAKWLSDNNVLLHLDASWCSIRLAGARAMAKAVGDNNKLLSLNISNNSFTNETVDVLIESLTRNVILTELNLEGNHISCRFDSRIHGDPSILIIGKEAFCYRLLVAAATNQSLKRLLLGKNHLDARCIKFMLEALEKLENLSLEELDLTGSSFTNKDLMDIHRYFAHHPKLTCYLGPVRQTVEKFANNLLNSVQRHCRDNHLTVNDLFPNDNDPTTPLSTVTYDEFRHGLRKARIPFPVAQIGEIMKYLGSENEQGTISLRILDAN